MSHELAANVRRISERLLSLAASLDRSSASRRSLFLWLAAALLLVQRTFGWNGNEEDYFLLARQLADPGLLHTYTSTFDHGGGKFAGFWLIGQLSLALGLTPAHLLLTLCSIGLYAYAIARLLQLFDCSIVDALLLIATFTLSGQAIMGHEWLFGGVETKTFAYGLVFLALADAMLGRWALAAFWSACATYMHFLVGGFWAAVVISLLLMNERDPMKAGKSLLLFCVLTTPLLAVLAHDQLLPAVRPPTMPSADFIYALRNDHHIAPFGPGASWPGPALRGVLCCFAAIVAGFHIRRTESARLALLATGVIGIAGYAIAAVLLAYLDRHRLVLSKLYLFRPCSLGMLLALLMLILAWRREAGFRARYLPVAALLLAFLCQAASGNLNQQEKAPNGSTLAMIQAVKAYTNARDVVLLDPATDQQQGITMRLDRDTAVSWKFVPTDAADIYRWWGLIQQRKRLFAGDCTAPGIPAQFLVIGPNTPEDSARCGREIWSNGAYHLISLRGGG